jgi:nitrogenase iron protein NifH
MALYAANNINTAVKNFEDRSYAKVRGIVMNRRAVEGEEEKVRAFAESAGLDIVADIPRTNDIIHYEDMGKTVIEGDPTLEVSKRFLALAQLLIDEDQ